MGMNVIRRKKTSKDRESVKGGRRPGRQKEESWKQKAGQTDRTRGNWRVYLSGSDYFFGDRGMEVKLKWNLNFKEWEREEKFLNNGLPDLINSDY